MNWVLEADICDCFDSIVQEQLKEMLGQRISNSNFLRWIGKWLRVGVFENCRLLSSEEGLAQGSVISPILANIYLHEVLDLWVENAVKPVMRGPIKLYRFCDDFIVTFVYHEDALRFHAGLAQRFGKFGVTLHPEKTRIIEFGRSAWHKSNIKQTSPPNFLGFTVYGARSQKGKFTVKMKTMGKRLSRGLKKVG